MTNHWKNWFFLSLALISVAALLILAPGEIDYFREVFGSRARIYPTGGHCGNIDYQQNVDYMLNLFSE